MRSAIKRFGPLAILGVLIVAALMSGLHEYLSLDTLRQHQQALRAFVADNSVMAAFAFVLAYLAVVSLSLPGATVMTVAGGFLFGTVFGGVLAIVAATLGAVAIFLIARTAFADALKRRAAPLVRRMEEGFRADAFNYLLFLRLVPAFPFWAVNLAPALLGVKLGVFAAATLIGIIPGTFVFAAFGAGLGNVFAAGEEVSLANVLNPTLLAAFVGLGLLALAPVLIRKWRRR